MGNPCCGGKSGESRSIRKQSRRKQRQWGKRWQNQEWADRQHGKAGILTPTPCCPGASSQTTCLLAFPPTACLHLPLLFPAEPGIGKAWDPQLVHTAGDRNTLSSSFCAWLPASKGDTGWQTRQRREQEPVCHLCCPWPCVASSKATPKALSWNSIILNSKMRLCFPHDKWAGRVEISSCNGVNALWALYSLLYLVQGQMSAELNTFSCLTPVCGKEIHRLAVEDIFHIRPWSDRHCKSWLDRQTGKFSNKCLLKQTQTCVVPVVDSDDYVLLTEILLVHFEAKLGFPIHKKLNIQTVISTSPPAFFSSEKLTTNHFLDKLKSPSIFCRIYLKIPCFLAVFWCKIFFEFLCGDTQGNT